MHHAFLSSYVTGFGSTAYWVADVDDADGRVTFQGLADTTHHENHALHSNIEASLTLIHRTQRDKLCTTTMKYLPFLACGHFSLFRQCRHHTQHGHQQPWPLFSNTDHFRAPWEG